jgi:hypothetical protein
MRQIVWVLLIGPPALAILTWLMTRGWISMIDDAESAASLG